MKRLLTLLLLLIGCTLTTQAQQTVFVPTCAGTNDTAKFSAIITSVGSNTATIRLPYKNGTRCAVNNLTIPSNVTLDNTDGTGIKINTGQTLTIVGPVSNPPNKQIFYNATAGLGTVVFTGNTSVLIVYGGWWGSGGAANTAAQVALATASSNPAYYGAYATTAVPGFVAVSTAPASPTLPTVYSTNDVHQPITTAPVYYASQYASLNTAISTIGSAQATLVVTQASTAITTVSIPATLTLRFDGAGSLSLTTGQTITILSDNKSWPRRQIFVNAVATQGTISFSGNKLITYAYPEWWGPNTTPGTTDNATFFNAANAALVTIGSGEISLAPTNYAIGSMVTLGSTSTAAFYGISMGGTNGLVGTTITWTGSTAGTAISVARGRSNNIHDFFLTNGVAKGTTIGLIFTGALSSNSQTSGPTVSHVAFRGFNVHAQAGVVGDSTSASELLFQNCSFDNSTALTGGTGFLNAGTGNSLVITFETCSWGTLDIGADISVGGSVTFHNPSFSSVALGIKQQVGGAPLTVDGNARFEMNPSDVAISVTNASTTRITGASFVALSTVPTAATIQTRGQVIAENCIWGSGSNTGWKTIEVNTVSAVLGSLRMSNNIIFGTAPFYIDGVSSTSDKLDYLLFGNEKWASSAFDSRFPDEWGTIVWPNMVSWSKFTPSGSSSTQVLDWLTTAQYINGSAPATPASGKVICYTDSADKIYKCKDDAGVVRQIGGASVSPRLVASCSTPAITATQGTDTTPVNTETYIVEVYVPTTMTVTGVALLNGSAVAGNVKISLATSAGVPIGGAVTASTAQAGTAVYQLIPFAASYSAVGPATYYLLVQFDTNTTPRFRTHTVAGTCGASKKTGETYGTFTTVTAPTTFTTALGPIVSLY